MTSTTASEIATSIEDAISRGELSPGDRLESVRQLAEQLGVSPTTVGAAYRRLRDRGLAVGRGRQGTRVAPLATVGREALSTITAVPDDLVDAVNGSPDPALLPDLANAFAAALGEDQAGYGDAMLDERLARVARDRFGADGVDATELTITSGSMDAVERVLRAQDFRAGDRIGVEDPGHVPLHQVVRSLALEPVPLALDAEGPTVAGLGSALARGLRALVITPRAQNPTGAALTPARADALSDVLASYPDVVVIHDDHAGPVAGADFHAVARPGQRWATIRSLGKSYGPDLRLALVVGDARTIDRVTTGFANGPGWVSHVLQRAAAFLLADPAAAATIERAAAAYQERRVHLVGALADRGIPATGRSGLNVWIPTSDEQAAVDAVRRHGYAIRAGGSWRIVSPPAVRVSVSHLDVADLDRIADALATTGRRRTRSRSV